MSAVFTEIGFDRDNNKYFLGISTEVEAEDGTEIRKPGCIRMKLTGCYFRIWIFKTVVGIGIPGGFTLKKKSHSNFKLVVGCKGAFRA